MSGIIREITLQISIWRRHYLEYRADATLAFSAKSELTTRRFAKAELIEYHRPSFKPCRHFAAAGFDTYILLRSIDAATLQ